MLETVAKPMLQMLETQRESSTNRIQSLQTKLERLSLGINNDDHYCDGKYSDDDYEEIVSENKIDSSGDLSLHQLSLVDNKQPKQREKGKKSSMVSSPV